MVDMSTQTPDLLPGLLVENIWAGGQSNVVVNRIGAAIHNDPGNASGVNIAQVPVLAHNAQLGNDELHTAAEAGPQDNDQSAQGNPTEVQDTSDDSDDDMPENPEDDVPYDTEVPEGTPEYVFLGKNDVQYGVPKPITDEERANLLEA